ncbi:uncharacterized protein LJ206_007646 isoform 1-T1 [Theristicus caerulescens]
MQVTEKDSTTTTSWGSHSLGQVQPGYSQCDGMGNFFPVAEPAAGYCAGGAIEIARAAELENDRHGLLLNGGTDLCESRYSPPTSHALPPSRFQQHLWVSCHELLLEMLLAENSIWSSKVGERRTESRSPKVGVFHLGNSYPVKTDGFTLPSFNGREEAGGVAGQQHGQAVLGQRAAPAPAGCDVPLPPSSLPQVPAKWRSCSLMGQDLVWAPPEKKSTKAEQTAPGPLLGEGSLPTYRFHDWKEMSNACFL